MSANEPVQIKVTVDEMEAVKDFKKLEKGATKAFRTFSKESKKGEQSAKRFSKALGGIKGKLLGLVGGIGVAATARKAVQLFLVQEKAVIRLDQALKLQGVTARSVSQDMQEYASALQLVTIHGDEAHLAGMSLAMSMGASADQAKELAVAASELSAAMGIGLDQATRQMAKTLGGFAGELGEILPGLKEFNREQLQAGAAISMIRAKFAGSAAAVAGSGGGQLTQAMNALGDQLEKLGKELLPVAILLAEMAAGGAEASAEFIHKSKESYFRSLSGMAGLKAKFPTVYDLPKKSKSQIDKEGREQLAAAELEKRRVRINALLAPAGMRGLRAGAAESSIEKLEGARGELTAAQIAKVVEGSLSGVQKAQRNIGFLEDVRGFIGKREGIPDESGTINVTPRRNRIDDLIRGERMGISRMENPEIHAFTEDFGMGVQRSLEGALKTAFTGGDARAVLEQFGSILGEAVLSSLAQNLASGLIGESGLFGSLEDLALVVGSSGGGSAKPGDSNFMGPVQ